MNLDKNMKRQFNLLAIICIIILSAALTPVVFQNDTYYTIKIGEYILDNGITMKDPFSWHDLSYTYPHWAYDVMMFSIYNLGGFLGIYLSSFFFTMILGSVMNVANDKFAKNKRRRF